MKKLIYLLIILIILGLAGGGWWLWQQSKQIQLSTLEPTGGSLFPEGGERDFGAPATATSSLMATTSTTQLDAPLTRVSDRPVIAVFPLRFSSTTNLIAYVERPTGHVYGLGANGSSLRLSNTTIPKIGRALGQQLSATLGKFIFVINEGGRLNNLLGTLALAPTVWGDTFISLEDNSLGAIETVPLSANIISPAVAPTGGGWAYLTPKAQGVDVVITNFASSSPQVIYNSPLSEWLLSWPAESTIALQTKPASFTRGVLLLINTRTKAVERLVGGVSGLNSLLSPDTQTVVYSGSVGQGLFLGRFHRPSGAIGRLPIQTLVDKCVWSIDNVTLYCAVPKTLPSANYPEHWYQGRISFNDNIWKLNTATNEGVILTNPELAGIQTDIDATNLVLNETEDRLYFINKRDGGLWSLRLNQGF